MRILSDRSAFRLWKRSVLRGYKRAKGAAGELADPVVRYDTGFFSGDLNQPALKDFEDEELRDEEDDSAEYPFYDPEYLVTRMYASKRGAIVSTPDRGEQCIYWAGQEMPGGSGNLEKAEKTRRSPFSSLSLALTFSCCPVFTNNKTFPGLLFITIPVEYKQLADGKIHEASELPRDAATRSGADCFFGFYFAEGLDAEVRASLLFLHGALVDVGPQGNRHSYRPVAPERLEQIYAEHRGAWVKPHQVPDDNLEKVAGGVAWLPCYAPARAAVVLAERQLRNEKGTAAEEEARDTSKQIAEEGPVELEARPFFRSSRHTFF